MKFASRTGNIETRRLSAEAVRACYRVLLGREPENADVVDEKTRHASYEELLSVVLDCEEYARRFPRCFDRYYYTGKSEIEVAADSTTLTAMFERIRGEWSALGESEPYWSVSTGESFRAAAIDEEAIGALYESGATTAGLIDSFAERCGVDVDRGGVCLEFGCGVGRVTTHLARRFREVIAVDISAGNLAICAERLKREGLDNVRTVLISSPNEIGALPGYDFLFSTIVFQHNPPPVQHYLLDILLSKIASRGGFLFQLPTDTPGYRFRVSDYLASAPGILEMHCLPMVNVFNLMSKHQFTPLEVSMDGWTGLYGSHTFFGVKTASV